jgi:hypothetical protein
MEKTEDNNFKKFFHFAPTNFPKIVIRFENERSEL